MTYLEDLNMKYLVIAVQSNNGFNATLYERDNNTALFDFIEEQTRNCNIIDEFNYSGMTNGRMVADNIEDIEPAMRKIGFRKCDICGAWVPPQDIRNRVSTWDGATRKCGLCVAKETFKTLPLHGYHDTSYEVRVINGDGENFDLSNVLGIGIEVEYYNPRQDNRTIKCTNAFYEIAKEDALNRMFRCERDCTVTGEIISNVFTKKSLYDFDFQILTDVLKLNGNVEDNDEAGLHVHLSKLWLGTNNKEQCLNFLKLQYFMKSYEEDFLKMSGRKRERMRYCKFFTDIEINEMKNDILIEDDPWDYMPHEHGGGDGCALNASGATIEFRIGKNTNDPERMKHYLRFILGITENIKNVPFSKCYCIRKVTRLVPEDTMNYWRKQGCFLRTNAINERGVTL